ncbi:MAG: peptide chain release factor N(5)-glutamine methyltransferase [Ideonella sp.]|nr:peptide chain release factor N(5)-glutamine methyltransferase [Ideonella sp.]MCC7457256.1 peptide chain release factor N(5)-glutamine methyltransferase [Nitrospira sp.]
MTAPTVDRALAGAQRLRLDRLDATRLLAHHLQCRREWLLAHGDATLTPEITARYLDDCRRRADDVPLAYLIGQREFMGLELQVTPAVLVPRPETELLAQWAIEQIRAWPSGARAPRVVDLGTGSGALALAIASACPRAEVVATDVSRNALAVAQGNARRLQLPVRFAHGHWWHAVRGERFDLAVANPPYVAPGDPHLAALRHEPAEALVADDAGLAALHQVIDGARAHLSGWLLLEHGWDQAEAVRDRLVGAGCADVALRRDLQGHARCTGGRIE